MQEGECDLKDSFAYLTALTHEIKPDILHLNHVCYGSLPVTVPRIVVAHGDLISWWKAVHGREPDDSRWLAWYREVMMWGLSQASMVVAPSAWMLDEIHSSFLRPACEAVVYPGRNPLLFNPYVTKDDSVLTVGRLLDAGKQVSLLTQRTHPLPVCIVSDEPPALASKLSIRADVKLAVADVNVALRGPQNEAQMRGLYSKASVYAATSRYEPFGLSLLEAALSRCAIVANDIPSFREIWGDAALFFRTNDEASLAEILRKLRQDPDLCRAYGNRAYQRARQRFTTKHMLDEYQQLYRSMLRAEPMAA
jgi:glycosyltransferase involved in cell wall biosynthesis